MVRYLIPDSGFEKFSNLLIFCDKDETKKDNPFIDLIILWEKYFPTLEISINQLKELYNDYLKIMDMESMKLSDRKLYRCLRNYTSNRQRERQKPYEKITWYRLLKK